MIEYYAAKIVLGRSEPRSNSPQPYPAAPPSPTCLGITLRGIRRVREALIRTYGSSRFEQMSTADVNFQWVRPLTFASQLPAGGAAGDGARQCRPRTWARPCTSFRTHVTWSQAPVLGVWHIPCIDAYCKPEDWGSAGERSPSVTSNAPRCACSAGFSLALPHISTNDPLSCTKSPTKHVPVTLRLVFLHAGNNRVAQLFGDVETFLAAADDDTGVW